jgi:hypothetical protein
MVSAAAAVTLATNAKTAAIIFCVMVSPLWEKGEIEATHPLPHMVVAFTRIAANCK